jgi:hypothetical protein
MAEESTAIPKGALQAQRIYEQPQDAISFYCDLAQILATENEIVMQFYETIPGPPGPGGTIASVRSRLRATITLSIRHSQNIGRLLIEKTKEEK